MEINVQHGKESLRQVSIFKVHIPPFTKGNTFVSSLEQRKAVYPRLKSRKTQLLEQDYLQTQKQVKETNTMNIHIVDVDGVKNFLYSSKPRQNPHTLELARMYHASARRTGSKRRPSASLFDFARLIITLSSLHLSHHTLPLLASIHYLSTSLIHKLSAFFDLPQSTQCHKVSKIPQPVPFQLTPNISTTTSLPGPKPPNLLRI